MRPARRLRTAAAALAVIVTASLTTVAMAPSAAAAAVPCTVKPVLPKTISIDRMDKKVAVKLTGCAGRTIHAGTDFYGPGGTTDFLFWSSSRTEYLTVYDFDAVGPYRTIDGYAYTTAFDTVGWADTATVVKFASRLAASSSRTGSVTTINVSATRYSKTYHKFTAWPSRSVTIQTASKAGGPWKTIKTVKTNAAGKGTVKFPVVAGKYYRAYLAPTATFFSATSNTMRR